MSKTLTSKRGSCRQPLLREQSSHRNTKGKVLEETVQGARPQSLPPEDDAQGDIVRLHEQHLLVPTIG